MPVRLELHVRKFFCDAVECPRSVFTERLPTVAATYARKTARLTDLLTDLGFALGGEAGARFSDRMHVDTSPDSLLRAIRTAAEPAAQPPRVLGVDDFALRRGKTYGTILVDHERGVPIDLLPDREADTLAAWLNENPGIEIVTRDRALAYAEGIREGAPDAMQIADRWHLLKNLGEAVERVLEGKRTVLRGVANEVEQELAAPSHEPLSEKVSGPPHVEVVPQTKHDRLRAERRERRVDRYDEIHRLYKDGYGKRAIARKMGISRKTVSRHLASDVFPERAIPDRPSSLDIHAEFLKQRWDEGCRNAAQLHREMVERGVSVSGARVRQYIRRWRPEGSRGVGRKTQEELNQARVTRVKVPSPRQAMWLVTREAPEEESVKSLLRARLLERSPEIAKTSELALEFAGIVRERRGADLDTWIEKAKTSRLTALSSFAEGLERDYSEVRAALDHEWSNGPVEGHVNRLKMIKRQMYGRASFDLLRARVLRVA